MNLRPIFPSRFGGLVSIGDDDEVGRRRGSRRQRRERDHRERPPRRPRRRDMRRAAEAPPEQPRRAAPGRRAEAPPDQTRRAVRQERRLVRRDNRGRIIEVIEEEAPIEEIMDELPIDDEGYDDEGDDDGDDLGWDPPRTRRWAPAARMGRFRIQAPEGTRAAVVKLAEGLYLVAECPEQQLSGIGGPVKLATKITDAAKRALSKPVPPAVPPAPTPPKRRRMRWEDDELGCDRE